MPRSRWNSRRRRIDSASAKDRERERIKAELWSSLLMLLKGHRFEEAKAIMKKSQGLKINLRKEYRSWLRAEVAGILALDREFRRDANSLKKRLWLPLIEFKREFGSSPYWDEEVALGYDEVCDEVATVYSELMPREPLSGPDAN